MVSTFDGLNFHWLHLSLTLYKSSIIFQQHCSIHAVLFLPSRVAASRILSLQSSYQPYGHLAATADFGDVSIETILVQNAENIELGHC